LWQHEGAIPEFVVMPVETPAAILPFIGSEVDVADDAAQIVVLPIPYEATTTYRKGCQNGPAALLAASDQLEYYDEDIDREICFEVGIHTHHPIADTRSHPDLPLETMLQTTRDTVSQLVADGKFVIALGGEHGISAGVVAGYRQANPDDPFTVVQIDAHADLRDEYEGSRYNHACVMRRIVEMGLPTVGIGIRSLCREEADFIRDRHLPTIRDLHIASHPDWIDRAIAAIPTDRVFLTIDLDGIDPSLIPGVGTPQPGGLDWHQLTEFLRHLFARRAVIGCDVMELSPIANSVVSEFTAAKLVYKLMAYQALARE
jgi:agmatinase